VSTNNINICCGPIRDDVEGYVLSVRAEQWLMIGFRGVSNQVISCVFTRDCLAVARLTSHFFTCQSRW